MPAGFSTWILLQVSGHTRLNAAYKSSYPPLQNQFPTHDMHTEELASSLFRSDFGVPICNAACTTTHSTKKLAKSNAHGSSIGA
jgi:hypothetical protein